MGKFRQYKRFYQDLSIQPYLPDTALCNPAILESFLDKYHTVFIKPTGGGRGVGVTKAWKQNNQYAYVIERGQPVYCSSVPEMYQKLNLAAKKPHVVQRGIQLAQVQGRPYDMRLMMMRDTNKKWQYVAMLAKVAGVKSIITNVARGGGYTITVEEALNQSLNITGEKATKVKNEMIRLGHNCNRVYSRYRYDWQIGYDIAIDTNGKLWLIEANPRTPSHFLFARLKDKTQYRKIKRMAFLYKSSVKNPLNESKQQNPKKQTNVKLNNKPIQSSLEKTKMVSNS
nr:YheC/YheD family protein [Aneurinibacillus tyrosinisolvens]